MYVIGDMFPQDTSSNSLERLLLVRSGRGCNKHVYNIFFYLWTLQSLFTPMLTT